MLSKHIGVNLLPYVLMRHVPEEVAMTAYALAQWSECFYGRHQAFLLGLRSAGLNEYEIAAILKQLS